MCFHSCLYLLVNKSHFLTRGNLLENRQGPYNGQVLFFFVYMHILHFFSIRNSGKVAYIIRYPASKNLFGFHHNSVYEDCCQFQ